MNDFHNFRFILMFVFGLFMVLCFLGVGIRGLITKRPFLFSAKWLLAFLIVCFCPALTNILSVGNNSFQLMRVGVALLFGVSLYIFWIQLRGYIVFGVTDKSMREALLHTLKKLGVGYEETLGALKLSSGAGEIQVSVSGGMGSGMIRAKKMQDKKLFSNIAAEMNLFFRTTPVETNKTIFIIYSLLGLLLAAFALVASLTIKNLFHQRDGWGKETYSDSSSYEGYFKNGKRSGHGKITWSNGGRYDGEFKDGRFNGTGVLVYANGDRYVGEFKDDLSDGRGVLMRIDGSRYEGEFRRGQFNGKGVFVYGSGDQYQGEFMDGSKDGTGILTYVDGSKYDGKFKKDYFDGKGILINATLRYEGEFKQGRKHGQGVMSFFNGLRVDGKFKDDWVAEDVIVTYPNGNVFEGDCKNGLDHCKGLLTSKDGKKNDYEIESWNKVMEETTKASFSSQNDKTV